MREEIHFSSELVLADLPSYRGTGGFVGLKFFENKLDEVAVAENWDSAHKCLVCRLKLAGLAAYYVHGNPKLRNTTRYSVLIQALRSRFGI